MCELLEKTPAVELETRIENLFNIDRALWFLALENIFMDNDSYVAKASDYALYQDGLHSRIHLLQQDGSEPFGVRGPEWGADAKVSPVLHEDNPARPLIYRLLAVPHLRARYLAHYRTITRDWLSRESILPIMDRYLRLISKEVSRDQKKIFSRELFEKNREEDVEVGRLQISGLLSFIDKRRSYLLSHPELDRPAPSIKLLPISSKRTILRVRLSPAPEVERVLLHHCANRAGVLNTLRCWTMEKTATARPTTWSIPPGCRPTSRERRFVTMWRPGRSTPPAPAALSHPGLRPGPITSGFPNGRTRLDKKQNQDGKADQPHRPGFNHLKPQ